MTKEQATSLIRRIACSGRLPDHYDVAIAEVCNEFLGTGQSEALLKNIRQRNWLLTSSCQKSQPREKGKE